MFAPRDGSQKSVLCNRHVQCCVECPGAEPKGLSSAAPLGRRLRGLSWNKTHQCWRVRIYCAGKLRFVGRYTDAITAARAYDKAAVYLYGVNAITNFGIQACLADTTTEIGPCIVRATLEAEEAAAAKPPPFGRTPDSMAAAAAAAAGSASCRNVTPSSSLDSSRVSSSDSLQHISPFSSTVQGGSAHVGTVMGLDIGKQQQQLLLQGNASCIGMYPAQQATCSSATATAAASSLQFQIAADAESSLKPSLVLPPDVSTLGFYHQLLQQQQQQQVLLAAAADIGSPSLPSIQCSHDAAAVTAATMFPAAASINNLAATQSGIQASMVQLLLQAQQQQQQMMMIIDELMRGSSPVQQLQTSFSSPLPAAAAAASAAPPILCQQQQPTPEQTLLFNLNLTRNAPAAASTANAKQTAATEVTSNSDINVLQQVHNRQQQQHNMLITQQDSQNAVAGSLALEQYLRALSLGSSTYSACIDNPMHSTAAAADIVGSRLMPGSIGPSWTTQL